MTTRPDRRGFLKQSAATAAVVGLGDLGALAPSRPARAAKKKPAKVRIQFDPETDRLAQLIQRNSRDRVIPVLVEQLRKGLSHRSFLAALFRTALRYHQGGHHIFVVHSINQMSLDVGRKERLLPLFWHLDLLKMGAYDDNAAPELDSIGPLSPPGKAAALFDAAVKNQDRETANRAIISLSRSEGPRAAFQRMFRYAAARYSTSQGHINISVSNACRTLEAIGWHHAETALRYNADFCCSREQNALDRANAARASRAIGKAPADWASSRSDKGAVLELISMFREGKAAVACESTCQQLLSGKLHAGAVWDAVFLTTNELSVRKTWAGGGPRHSITGTNAMHYAFRTSSEPEVRLFTLLQAVALTCSFLGRYRAAGDLIDFKITEIPQTDCPDSVEDAVDEIFSLLPPRRRHHSFRDRSGQEKALALTYAMARRHSDQRFLQTARRLLCLKSVGAHDFKFPVAAFENYQYLSPQWRPTFLAGSVFLLHGRHMEDNPAVQEAREALRNP